MTVATRVRDALAAEFAKEIAAWPGSEVRFQAINPDYVDLYLYPAERHGGHEWEIILPVKVGDGAVVVQREGPGVFVSREPGGTFDHVSDTGLKVPEQVSAICTDAEARVHALQLPVLAFEGREAGMFADLRAILAARKAGDDDALDEAVSAAWDRLSKIVPSMADELEPAPRAGMAP